MARHWWLAASLIACSGFEPPEPSSSPAAGVAGTSTSESGAGAGGSSASAPGGASGTPASAGNGGGVAGSAAGSASVGGAAGDSSAGGTSYGAGTSGSGGSGGTARDAGNFALTSRDLASGSTFSATNTCAGKGTSPALSWTPGPSSTKSYAITFFDTTRVEQGNANGYHWAIWDIPAATLALPATLPAGAVLSTPVTAKQSSPANPFDDFPANAYFGPCPNALGQTNNTDTYAFTIYALSVDALTGDLSSVKNVDAAIQATAPLASAKLSATSNAKPD